MSCPTGRAPRAWLRRRPVYRPVSHHSPHRRQRLVIPKGVTMLVSDDRSSWKHDDVQAVIYNKGYDNITITGGHSDPRKGGVIDGQGLTWWQHKDDFRPNVFETYAYALRPPRSTFTTSHALITCHDP